MSRCSCTLTTLLVAGESVEGIVEHDGDCPVHGLPHKLRGPWDWPARAGHLRRHARELDYDEEVVIGEGQPNEHRFRRRVRRLETPREVEARLLREAAA